MPIKLNYSPLSGPYSALRSCFSSMCLCLSLTPVGPACLSASKSAPGTFPVLGTAAPAWGTLLLLDPIGRYPVAVGNFQMTLFPCRH